MAHRAGTGDAPIPGVITSRRNPAYRLRPRVGVPLAKGRDWKHGRRSSSRSPKRSRSQEEADLRRERREQEDLVRREAKEVEEIRLKLEDEENQKRRWAEQEAKWAEERRAREEQKVFEEQRQAERKKNLKGAFAVAGESEGEDEDVERARELARQRRRAERAAPALALAVTGVLSLTGPAAKTSEKEDAVRLRASLADPSAPRAHAPGEVAEHFRRLSEMKRRFRRAEFGGPDRRRDPSPRSRSRERYASVWIRPGSLGSRGSEGESRESRDPDRE
uniref:Uncharacterized protein n=1 Tax=Noctiluca scintillans TaxID=2966 RepID=A0A7S1FAJ1_NOCSC|mmetsp:Transcript_47851/g.126665  ORF Transcript_47851/g.126665 Transcript_47851/m.126665 type:complete len:277 (+) Transcript_47851:34-864(+)